MNMYSNYPKRRFATFLSFIVAVFVISGCHYENIEPIEFGQRRSMSDVSWVDVPILTENLRANLGAANGGLYSYGGRDEALDFRIDWDNITQYTDSLGNVSYTLIVIDEVFEPYVFRNVIIRQYDETSFSQPMLYTYEMADEFKAIYDQTQSIHGFTGTVKKQMINADLSPGLSSANIEQQRGTVSGPDCPGSQVTVGTSTGGGSGTGSTGPGSDPRPGSGITYEVCDTEWLDFDDVESCGFGCITNSQSILVTTCYTVEMSKSGDDPCDEGEVAVVSREKPVVLDSEAQSFNKIDYRKASKSKIIAHLTDYMRFLRKNDIAVVDLSKIFSNLPYHGTHDSFEGTVIIDGRAIQITYLEFPVGQEFSTFNMNSLNLKQVINRFGNLARNMTYYVPCNGCAYPIPSLLIQVNESDFQIVYDYLNK